jgi:hypothetical protein
MEMKAFLAKYVPPLSPAQVEEIAAEHERLVAVELETRKETLAIKKKGK